MATVTEGGSSKPSNPPGYTLVVIMETCHVIMHTGGKFKALDK